MTADVIPMRPDIERDPDQVNAPDGTPVLWGEIQVPSKSNPGGSHTVQLNGLGGRCDCAGWSYRGRCRHIAEARQAELDRTGPPVPPPAGAVAPDPPPPSGRDDVAYGGLHPDRVAAHAIRRLLLDARVPPPVVKNMTPADRCVWAALANLALGVPAACYLTAGVWARLVHAGYEDALYDR